MLHEINEQKLDAKESKELWPSNPSALGALAPLWLSHSMTAIDIYGEAAVLRSHNRNKMQLIEFIVAFVLARIINVKPNDWQ